MLEKSYRRYAFVLSLSGVLFSGYLSFVKFFTKNCALSEPCPLFFGFPACYFGFGLFLGLFIFSLSLFCKGVDIKDRIKVLIFISFLGVLFASWFSLREIPNLISGNTRYSLGLPTCAYGLIFFLAIFVLSFFYYKKDKLG